MPNRPLQLHSPGGDLSEASFQMTPRGDDRRQRELDRISGLSRPQTMPVEFGLFVKLLSQAMEDDCTWLDDFAEDTIQIDADLHEVLLTYQRLRQRAAA